MKLFLDSEELSRRFSIRFIKTNFRSSSSDKGKGGIAAAVWTTLFYARLLKHLILFRPTAVYYPITPTALGWLARDAPCIILCRMFRAKVIIHLRGSHLRSNVKEFRSLLRRAVKYACGKTAIALVQAECLRDQFKSLVPDDRIRVLPQAIDSRAYDPGESRQQQEKQVLFLGNLSYSKGYCDLVRAIPLVVAAIPDAKFVCCGSMREGPSGVYFNQISGERLVHESPRKAHEEISNSKYRNNYEWRGVVSGEEKMCLLRSSAVITLPSYSEGFSRALLEAMSVGKPLVCTPVGAHREYIRDGVNGLLVPPGDVRKLAEAIIALLSEPRLRGILGENNYRYVRQSFDISSVSLQLGGFIADAIDGRP
jgi:glycosyltransferase involved in cell wall biosynthesis